jgi:hypothetical protein
MQRITVALSNMHGDGATSIKQDSLLNILGSGAVTLPGDFAAVIETYVANGLIAGNGVPGAVEVDLTVNEGFTTITALAIPESVALVMALSALGAAAAPRRRCPNRAAA